MSGAFGPFTREQFMALRGAPAGAFVKAIREHDPAYGLPPPSEGAKRFRVLVERTSTLTACCETFIEAETEAEAINIAMRNAEAGEYAFVDTNSWDGFDVTKAEEIA